LAFDGDIDLTNQYRALGIDHTRGAQPVRETGLARYTFPAGASLFWVPFVHAGHIGVWLRNFHGLETSYDGFADPYLHTVALANLLFGWVGLLVLDKLLGRWFSPAVRFAACAGIGLGSFLLWYLAYQPIYTHALTFLLSSLFLYRWLEHRKTVADYAILGFLMGLAACVRWQNAVFGLLPAWSLIGALSSKRWRFFLTASAALAASASIGMLPQIVSWKVIFDRLFIGVPLGVDYMRWSDPFLSEILFSSRHGLFSWSPLLAFAILGLVGFVFRERRTGVPLMCLVLIQVYINSAVSDWWGGGSFGARRFDSTLPIFAIGLANLIQWAVERVRRRPEVAVAAALASIVLANMLLVEQYRKDRVPTDDTISWEIAAQGMLEDVFDAVGYPFSFPANWIFSLRYDRPKTQYDILIGKYLYHFLGNMGGLIDLGRYDPPFIGNGWSGVTNWEDPATEIRLAVGHRAGILVPLHQPEHLAIIVECATPVGTEPQRIEVWLNHFRLGAIFPDSKMSEYRFHAGERWWRRINLLEVVPEKGFQSPYLAVDRVRFERLDR
jgi:hypothetical protein